MNNKKLNSKILSEISQIKSGLESTKKLQDIAKSYGFDWDKKEASWLKVEEEIEELKVEVENNDYEKQKDEFGDVLFALVNFGRFLNIDSEEALKMANKKFTKRLLSTEQLINQESKDMGKLSQKELTYFWKKAKTIIDKE